MDFPWAEVLQKYNDTFSVKKIDEAVKPISIYFIVESFRNGFNENVILILSEACIAVDIVPIIDYIKHFQCQVLGNEEKFPFSRTFIRNAAITTWKLVDCDENIPINYFYSTNFQWHMVRAFNLFCRFFRSLFVAFVFL